jgi:ketosteroid isomerase-like protein
MTGIDQVVRDGLRAWAEGDLSALEALLHPDAELLWYKPGAWDCHGREQVIGLLRQRREDGSRPFGIRVDDIDDTTVVVSAREPGRRRGPDGPPVATVATIRDGKIIRLRQHRSRAAALAALGHRDHSGTDYV